MKNEIVMISQKLLLSLQNSWQSFINHLPNIVLGILIVTMGLFLARKITSFFEKTISFRMKDPIMSHFLAKTIKILVSLFFIMYALKISGLEDIAGAMLAAAGATTLIVGFAFRDIGENFIAGIILSFNRPFNVNETVRIGDAFGKIKSIEFRYTKLKTFDGRDVYIPNSDVIKKPVFNYTEDGYYRFEFMVGIAYENNITEAIKMIMECLKSHESVYQDDDHQYFINVDELAVSTVNLKVHFWVETLEYGREALLKKGQVIADVKATLLGAGFSLPASVHEIKFYDENTIVPIKLESFGKEPLSLS